LQQGTDRCDPRRADCQDPPGSEVYAGGFYLWLRAAHFLVTAHVYQYHEVDGMLEVNSMEIDDRRKIGPCSIWTWQFNRYDAEVSIRDRREGEHKQRKNVTDAEMEQFIFPKPAFGDFDAIVRIVLGLLRSQGYGELE
jgi:hypothetical protein